MATTRPADMPTLPIVPTRWRCLLVNKSTVLASFSTPIGVLYQSIGHCTATTPTRPPDRAGLCRPATPVPPARPVCLSVHLSARLSFSVPQSTISSFFRPYLGLREPRLQGRVLVCVGPKIAGFDFDSPHIHIIHTHTASVPRDGRGGSQADDWTATGQRPTPVTRPA